MNFPPWGQVIGFDLSQNGQGTLTLPSGTIGCSTGAASFTENIPHKKRFEHTVDVLEFAQKKTVETTTIEELIAKHGLPFLGQSVRGCPKVPEITYTAVRPSY